jgi:ankyrin repeat protein
LATVSSEILNDKAHENRDVYIDVELPMIILAAIGGDIDIFSYFIDKGSNINSAAHITLSKKHRNSVTSNILGAAAYYGRVDLANYILDKYKKVDINFRAIEKKSKIKINLQNKEFTDFTPLLLSIVSDAPEDYSIHIIKLLHKYGANFETTDFAMNNILHLAVKYNKLAIIKFLVEKLNLYNEGINKGGHTPLGIASELGNTAIYEYLQVYSNRDSNINDLINELEQGKKKKQTQKKKKKEAKDEVLLGSTEYEETFKIKPKPPKEIKKEPELEPEPEEEPEVIEKVSDEGKRPYERRSYYKDNYYYDNNYYKKGYGQNYREHDYDYYDSNNQYGGNYKSNYDRNKGYYNDNTNQYNKSYDEKRFKEEAMPVEPTKQVENTNVIISGTAEINTNLQTKGNKSQIVGLNVKSKKKPHETHQVPSETSKHEVFDQKGEHQNLKQEGETVNIIPSQKADGLNELNKIYSTESYDYEGDEQFLTEEEIANIKPIHKNTDQVVEEVSEEVSEENKPSIDYKQQYQDEVTQKQLNEIIVILR